MIPEFSKLSFLLSSLSSFVVVCFLVLKFSD
nr:MAG TPA: hypothetical protein [Caudoviricetes sp.]